jgi:hypothetical protein
MEDFVDIVFDGPPGAPMPRLMEVEGPDGRAVQLGTWMKRDDGLTVMRIHDGDVRTALDAEPPDPTVFPNDE